MKATRVFCMSIAMAAVTMLAGCGGGDTPPPPPPDPTVTLPAGHGIPAGTHTIQPGDSRELGNVELTCPAGGMACVLTVGSVSSGTATFRRTGGTPTIMSLTAALSLPPGHGVGAATYTISPDEQLEIGDVVISCPAGGPACVVNVTSLDAETATYEETGGRPTVIAVLVTFGIEPYHGITDGEDISIRAGTEHHGRHGVSLACPAGGMDCVVSVSTDEWWYHRTGGVPKVLIHELARAANDQAGRAASVFTRDQMDDMGDRVSRLDKSSYEEIGATAVHDGTSVTFDLDRNVGAGSPPASLFDGLGGKEIDSNFSELDGWTSVALSQSDSASGLTIHANVYSDISDQSDTDYLILGAWLAVPDDINDSTSLVGVLVDGSDPFDASNIEGLTGSAIYQGPAVGIYEQRTAGSGSDVRIGSFVASAELRVDFDDAVLHATARGSLTGFKENDQSLGDWIVRLPSTSIDRSGGISNRFHGNPDLSSDGGVSYHVGAGDWSAAFFGNGPNGANPPTAPTSIAGSFEVEAGQRLTPVPNDTGYLGLVGAFAACHAAGADPGC